MLPTASSCQIGPRTTGKRNGFRRLLIIACLCTATGGGVVTLVQPPSSVPPRAENVARVTSPVGSAIVPAENTLEPTRPPAEEAGWQASPTQTPDGLQTSEWGSIQAAHSAWKHSFLPLANGAWQARNAGQSWTTEFDGRGFLATPQGQSWQWGLELTRYGFGDRKQVVDQHPVAVQADGQRLHYQWSADVQEWFVNDERGLEHGFTFNRRPAGGGANEWLQVELTPRGSLTPSVDSEAQRVVFRDASGEPAVHYSGLKVWDAEGTVLPSHFADGAGGAVLLCVHEAGARYPLTIDPLAQQAYAKASNAGAVDAFGTSVAVSGDTVVVGAPSEDSSSTGVNSTPNESASGSGAAYVFVRTGTTWTQQAYLKAGNTGSVDAFGTSVAVSGDTIVIGAPSEDSSSTGVNSTPNESASGSGAAYVFSRAGTTWTQQAYLKASNTGSPDAFGTSVAVSGDTVVVGAPSEDSSSTGVNSTPNESASGSGAAYMFSRTGTTWSQQAYLKASNTGSPDAFGTSVAVNGGTIAVGAPSEDSSSTGVNSTPNESASGAGAAYVFAAGDIQVSFTLAGGQAIMVFPGTPGRTYSVQRSLNLSNWTQLATVPADSDCRVPCTDASPPPGAAFYRAVPQ